MLSMCAPCSLRLWRACACPEYMMDVGQATSRKSPETDPLLCSAFTSIGQWVTSDVLGVYLGIFPPRHRQDLVRGLEVRVLRELLHLFGTIDCKQSVLAACG